MRSFVAAALLCATVQDVRAEEGPLDADALVPHGAPDDPEPVFPHGTRSLVLLQDTTLRAAPRAGANHVGRVAAETRVAWQTTADTPEDPACPRWIEIAPRGWLCATDVAPSPLEPSAERLPRAATGARLPAEFKGYATVTPRPDLITPDARRTCVPSGARPANATESGVSEWAGVWLECPDTPALPLAWVQGRLYVSRPVEVRARPWSKARVVKTLAPRTLVTPRAAHRDGYYVAIGEHEWVASSDLHVARVTSPPAGLLADERWIDIDLDEQVLVAYEGARPVFATLVSTGTPTGPTPLGTFRIEDKRALALMESRTSDGDIAYRGIIPWTQYYADHYALHAAYWHDRFGARMSHGCVNLAPLDARVLFAWTEPQLPDGWLLVHATPERPGSLVRIRNGTITSPRFRGYARDVAAIRCRAGVP